MESKLEPEYDRDGRDEGFDDNGLQASEGSATVERLPGGEMPELGSRRPAEDRHEEQEAADLLAQAEDLEPEYDFESAEGGVASPGQDDQLLEADQEGIAGLGRRPGLRVQGGQAVSQILEADSAREAGRRSLRPEEATRTLNGTAGQGKGSGGASSLAGWEEAGFTMQASARPPGDTSTWSIYGGRISEEARMETLETLVQQLLEQNERLKREAREHSSRSSCVSERDRVADVQEESRRVERRGTAEGRGTRPLGEVRVKSGKGVGSDGWTPTLKIFQPPWTNFGRSDEASSDALPAVGPGDRFLAATRALQQLHLDDADGGAGDDARMECSGEVPWPVPMSTSGVGLPQFNVAQEPQQTVTKAGHVGNPMSTGVVSLHQFNVAQEPQPNVVTVSNVGNSVECQRAGPQLEPHSVVQQHPPSAVTVIINGVPRRGVFNAEGEVVIQSESPKYFALGDQVRPSEAEGETQASANPFAAQASSPFRDTSRSRHRSPSVPPPPPPPPAPSRVSRHDSKSPGGGRSAYPRRPSRSPNPSLPRAAVQASYKVNASPATPGGTKVPRVPPPMSPPAPEVRSVAHDGLLSLEEGDAKDFRPGERTLWELPVLAPVGEANPAMRFSDWVHRVTPFFNDLAPRGHEWWQRVLLEAKAEYDKWCKAKPLERSRLVGRPSVMLQSERFVRIEARGVAMLTKALPSALYEQALSVRSVSCTCMLLLAMRMYQPGGLSERSELLKGLTGLAMCDNAVTAVAVLQKWFRHLERARTMEISVPDSSLLLDGVDKCMKGILQANPNLQFRIQNIRMHLQLDTAPTLETVEEYTRTLLAEMELLSVSAPDPTSKRQRIAAVGVDQDKGAKGQKGGKGGDGTQQSSAGNGRGAKGDRKLCSAWSTENGCPQGKLCQLAHTPEKPGACWVCGGPHQKFECKAPGGGKAPKLDGNSGAGADDSGAKPKKGKPKGNEAKGNPKSAATPSRGSSGSAGQTSGISEAAIKEAAQILQSLRLSAIRCDLKSASEILSKATERGRRGLIDGGATACLRTAHSSERSLPTISVRLAYGSCDLHINQYGTLLSEVPVSPIISVKALLRLGYRIDWNASRCRVYHPKFGDLEVDTSTGCPEVNEGVALELIDQYELYVGRQDTVGARLRCIMEDLRDTGNHDLLKVIHSGGAHGDAAFRVYVERLFPSVSKGTLEQCVVTLQDSAEEAPTWNRRIRRKCLRSQGVVVHAFCGSARKAFEPVSHLWDLTHLGVDVSEDMLNDNTFRFLLQQAREGKIRGVVGGPSDRTFSSARYLAEATGQGPRPIRVPGESIGGFGVQDLSCQEKAQRNIDDVLILRFLLLIAFAVDSNRAQGLSDPACIVEHPCAEDDLLQSDCSSGRGTQQAFLWTTPEWKILEEKFGLRQFRFFQGPIGHQKRRPTCLGTNLEPDPVLVSCSVPPELVDYVPKKDYGTTTMLWSEWAPGLVLSLSSMLHRAFAQMRHPAATGPMVQKVDPGFLHHLQQNHTPYRNDCVTCLKGSARRKQHRRVLTPQSWCLSVDTAGPFAKGRDEHTSKARYLIVGVLSVPILAVDGKEVDDPNDADPEPAPADAGGAIEDAEWFADGGVIEAEAEDELSLRETAEARTAWNEWDRLVKSSREDWIQDAQSEKLPKVEIVDFVYVEAIERKTHGEVLTAIGRMHARAKAEGFDVRRLHSDRGREYNNKPLRDWCARHAVHKTLAVAEEHQGNGRAEGAIMRVKSKTRTILEESASEKSDWPLAAKLAAHELKNAARKRLKLEMQQSLPFDTKVQVISRSWKRETWESRTTTAWVKCPSADMSRGWVVATEDGKLLTTGKLFPSVEQGKVSFSSTGPAVDVDAPERRVTGKRAIRLLQSSLLREPTHGADKLAKKLFEDNLFRPRDLAALAVQVSQLTQDSNRMVKPQETGRDEQRRTCNFLTGAFTYGGMTGLRSNTKDHPWVTRYLTAYMSKYASGLFAGVGLILNVDHVLHRDVHNQKGVPNIVLPVVTSGGGLWIQESENQVSSECVLGPVSAKVLPNTRQATGRVCEYRSHKAIKFHPNLWHESVSAHGQQLLLVGYTPRSLHKLTSLDRDMLGQTGFTLLPASKEEFWGYSHAEDILTRYHPVPRKHMFVPSDKEWLPVDRSCFGEVRYCIQHFKTGEQVRTTHNWRQGRGRAASQMWTGSSSFKLRQPDCRSTNGGGFLCSHSRGASRHCKCRKARKGRRMRLLGD